MATAQHRDALFAVVRACTGADDGLVVQLARWRYDACLRLPGYELGDDERRRITTYRLFCCARWTVLCCVH